MPFVRILNHIDLTQKIKNGQDGRVARSEITVPIMKFPSAGEPGKAAERWALGYFAASRMISSIAVSTSSAVAESDGSSNIFSIVVGLMVSRTTSLPSR